MQCHRSEWYTRGLFDQTLKRTYKHYFISQNRTFYTDLVDVEWGYILNSSLLISFFEISDVASFSYFNSYYFDRCSSAVNESSPRPNLIQRYAKNHPGDVLHHVSLCQTKDFSNVSMFAQLSCRMNLFYFQSKHNLNVFQKARKQTKNEEFCLSLLLTGYPLITLVICWAQVVLGAES